MYPQEFASETQAKLQTAKHALEQLKLDDQFPVCMDTDAELTIKLFDSLKFSPNGIFTKKIPEFFQ